MIYVVLHSEKKSFSSIKVLEGMLIDDCSHHIPWRVLFLKFIFQTFIFMTVVNFGPLTCSIVTTTRKFFTILGSVLLFGNVMSSMQWVGTVLVFLGEQLFWLHTLFPFGVINTACMSLLLFLPVLTQKLKKLFPLMQYFSIKLMTDCSAREVLAETWNKHSHLWFSHFRSRTGC